MGSILPRGKDKWLLRYDVPTTSGRKQKAQTFTGSRRAAERRLAEIEADARRGLLAEPTAETLGAFLVRWLEAMRPSWRHRTYMTHHAAITKHLVPALGHLKLGQISTEHVQNWYTTCGLHLATAKLYGRYLGEALNTAVSWDLIPKNPAARAKPPRVEETEREALAPDVLRAVLGALEGSWLRVPALLALTTGLRPGELVALRWSDFDLPSRTLRVRRQITRGPHGLIEAPPKTRRGRRAVLVGPEVAALLAAHRADQAAQREAAGSAWLETDLIICKGDGSAFRPDDLPKRWKALLRAAGVPWVRFYSLRHAQASYIVAGGEDIVAAAQRMGHRPEELLRQYAHLLPGREGKAATLADEVLESVRVNNP